MTDVWLLLELQGSAVTHVEFKFLRHAFGQLVDLGAQLFVSDLFVLLFLGSGWQTLPRQLALMQVYQNKSQTL